MTSRERKQKHDDLTRRLALSLVQRVGEEQASKRLGIRKSQLRRWHRKTA
jgi:hypothetical protein